MNAHKLGSPSVLELKRVSKSFPGVKALDNVSLHLEGGSVLALVGENGAGKSTIIKIITGVYTQDEGEITLRGNAVRFKNPQEAFSAGISAVHQERNIIQTFTVAENLLLKDITQRMGHRINMKEVNREATKYLELVGLGVSPKDNVEKLKSGQQQLLEIARALSSNAHIVMLDEPTASISVKEADILFTTVDRLRKQGYSFIYVTHKLEEVFAIANTVCVIRDGKNAGEIQNVDEYNRDRLIIQMVGRAESKKVYPNRDKTGESVVLAAERVTSRNNPHRCSFQLHRGEILGWYGLVGAGRTELAHEIIGVDPIIEGCIKVDGNPVTIRDTYDSLEKHGLAYITENRNLEGVFLMHDIKTNISASIWKKYRTRLGFVNLRREQETAEKFRRDINIKTPSLDQIVLNLSGGNRQKVSIAKGLATEPKILIFDEPTVGIDIETKQEIHDIIWNLAENGISIIAIISDMLEIVKLADRIVVFHEGEIRGELYNSRDYSEMSKNIMELIVGSGKLKNASRNLETYAIDSITQQQPLLTEERKGSL